MTSQFIYLRPRNIEGAYLVRINLDLGENETGYVDVARHRNQDCGTCGTQRASSLRQSPTKSKGRMEGYEIDNLLIGDTITLTIRVQGIELLQRSLHTMLREDIAHEMLPFTHLHDSWNVVPFNKIELFDLNYSKSAFGYLFDSTEPVLYEYEQAELPAAVARRDVQSHQVVESLPPANTQRGLVAQTQQQPARLVEIKRHYIEVYYDPRKNSTVTCFTHERWEV